MKTSADGIVLLHHFEGCSLAAYPDPATGGAPWTIGYGDTGPGVVKGLVITQAQADQRFADRLSREFEPGVLKVLAQEPDQLQFDAMVCLAYNIGLRNFAGSSVVKRFNTGSRLAAADAFLLWDKAAGKTMLGLKRRRTAERAMFLGSSAPQAIATGAQVPA